MKQTATSYDLLSRSIENMAKMTSLVNLDELSPTGSTSCTSGGAAFNEPLRREKLCDIHVPSKEIGETAVARKNRGDIRRVIWHNEITSSYAMEISRGKFPEAREQSCSPRPAEMHA